MASRVGNPSPQQVITEKKRLEAQEKALLKNKGKLSPEQLRAALAALAADFHNRLAADGLLDQMDHLDDPRSPQARALAAYSTDPHVLKEMADKYRSKVQELLQREGGLPPDRFEAALSDLAHQWRSETMSYDFTMGPRAMRQRMEGVRKEAEAGLEDDGG